MTQSMPAYGSTPAAGAEPPLPQPWYDAPFLGAYKRFWKKYAVFTGRAGRAEFWWAYLGNVIVGIVLGIISALLGLPGSAVDSTGTWHSGPGFLIGAILIWIFGLAAIVPNLAIYWRRMHDTGKSGWFILLSLIPFVGGIIALVLAILPPNQQGDKYNV
ncbi:DUF805 domain-containing protein [Gryllotalpicola ginsengisoli]|uniref:DUF805 domain-containing protein n=1 Tax=Gryllotalpicola ginsengisoli TaxID=444608 RepID=UPI0003B79F51|nr:DUF805 domain-containing protein [Gryllotalpicola ginsengisoli]